MRRTLVATVPSVMASATCLAIALVAHDAASWRPAFVAAVWLVGYMSMWLSNPVTGLLVPLIAELTRGQTLSPPPSYAELRGAIRRAFASSHVVIAVFVTLLGLALAARVIAKHYMAETSVRGFVTTLGVFLALLGYVAVTPLTLFGPVAAVEGASGVEPLRRSVVLTRPVRRATLGVGIYVIFVSVALTQLVRAVFTAMVPHSRLIDDLLVTLVSSVMTVAIFPFTAVSIGLLYLRARAAEGEAHLSGSLR